MAFEVQIARERDLATVERRLQDALAEADRGGGSPAARGLGGYEPHDAVQRLRTDREAAPGGSVTRLRLSLPVDVVDRVGGLELRATEQRLLDVAQRVLARELPRAQGVLAVRYDGADRQAAVHAFLSPRLNDGGAAPVLLRVDIAAIEDRWSRAVHHAVGLQPSRQIALRRAPSIDEQRLRQEFHQASDRLVQAMRARMRGEAPQEVVKAAGERAHSAQQAWMNSRQQAVTKEQPVRYDVVKLRVEGGRSFMGRLHPRDADVALNRAIRAAAMPVVPPRADLRIVHWHDRDDLRVAIMFNPRREGAPTREIDPADLRAALSDCLKDELEQKARHYDSQGRAEGDLGRVVVLEDRQPAREQREEDRPVRLRIERGAEYLQRIPPDRRRDTLAAVLERTFPFLAAEGLRDRFRAWTNGPALEVALPLPRTAGMTAEQLERPIFQFRFAREVQRSAMPFTGPGAPARAPLGEDGHVGRTLASAVARVVGDRLRGGDGAIGPTVNRYGWDALSKAMPRSLQVAHQIGRFITSLGRQDD